MGATIVKQGFTHAIDASKPQCVAWLQRKTFFFSRIGGQKGRDLVQLHQLPSKEVGPGIREGATPLEPEPFVKPWRNFT
jgi:hypothetical protein